MPDWLLVSIAGSILLTLALNLLPMLFPKSARRAQEKMIDEIRRTHARQDDPNPGPRVRVFFPWQAMLIGSVALTVIVNLVGYFARGY
jgi:hypothetical protein